MFLGYCFDELGYHTAATKLDTPLACFRYCLRWHKEWAEIRITDTNDFCVMHVLNHNLLIPFPNGKFQQFSLDDSGVLNYILTKIEEENPT